MEENIKKYFCKYCKNKSSNCMNIKIQKSKDICSYNCVNYYNNTPLEEYKKYIKYDYYDESGNFIAIIKSKTPTTIIIELRKHYDFVTKNIKVHQIEC